MKKKYRHYSFDLWQTLLGSNGNFKRARNEYLASNFNPRKYSLEEVQNITSEIAKMCDIVTESTATSFHPLEMYGMLLYRLGFDMSKVSQMDILSIINVMKARFLANGPPVYDNSADGTLHVLKTLKDQGATISITSNTGFVSGWILEQYLESIGIKQYIDFGIYSDSEGLSKPSPEIFGKMIKRAQALHSLFNREHLIHRDIVHVGDNYRTDILGAQGVGIDAIFVHGASGNTLKTLLV